MTTDRLEMPRLGLWTVALDVVGAAEAQDLAAEVEGLGYGAIWLPEVAGRDVMMHLAMLLSATERLVGATGIASIWGRDAVAMTGGAKGLTEAFPERVLVGLGVSHHTLVEGLRGHEYRRPLRAMETYLDAMEKAPYTAKRPVTPVRLVLAALGPKMLALSAARTNGAHTYFVTPEHTAWAREILGPDALLCVEQAVLLETDADKARGIAEMHTKLYTGLPNYQNSLRRFGFGDEDFVGAGSNRLIDRVVAWGDETAIVDRVRAHFAAGADHVCIQPLATAPRGVPADQWRSLAPAMVEVANEPR